MSNNSQTWRASLNGGCYKAVGLMTVVTSLLCGVPSSFAQQTPPKTDVSPQKQENVFVLNSPAVSAGGNLPVEFTGDGERATLPLAWSNAPAGTVSYAMIMHHEAPDRTKWYWILYNIPFQVHTLPKNVKDIGTQGNNSVNGRVEYAPPHSKGPGAKTYVYTVYALSSEVKITVKPEQVTRDVLLTAMKEHILGQAELKVVYTRQVDNSNPPPPR